MKISVDIGKGSIPQGGVLRKAVGKHGGIIEYGVMGSNDALQFLVFSYNVRQDIKNIAEFSVNHIVMGAEVFYGDNTNGVMKDVCCDSTFNGFSEDDIAGMLLDGKLKKRNLGFKTFIGAANIKTEFSLRLRNEEFCVVLLK